jgi:hypothetical protein
MDKRPAEKCPFSRPLTKEERLSFKKFKAVIFLKGSLSSFVKRPAERTLFSRPFVHNKSK